LHDGAANGSRQGGWFGATWLGKECGEQAEGPTYSTARCYNREMRNIHLKSGDQVWLGPDTISLAGTASPVCCRCLFWHHWLCSARTRIYTVSTAAEDLNAHSQAAAPTI